MLNRDLAFIRAFTVLDILLDTKTSTLLCRSCKAVSDIGICASCLGKLCSSFSGFHIGKEEYELRKAVKKIDFKELLAHFQHIQHKHVVARKTKSSHREKLHRDAR